jgi:hypothetical protein
VEGARAERTPERTPLSASLVTAHMEGRRDGVVGRLSRESPEVSLHRSWSGGGTKLLWPVVLEMASGGDGRGGVRNLTSGRSPRRSLRARRGAEEKVYGVSEGCVGAG